MQRFAVLSLQWHQAAVSLFCWGSTWAQTIVYYPTLDFSIQACVKGKHKLLSLQRQKVVVSQVCRAAPEQRPSILSPTLLQFLSCLSIQACMKGLKGKHQQVSLLWQKFVVRLFWSKRQKIMCSRSLQLFSGFSLQTCMKGKINWCHRGGIRLLSAFCAEQPCNKDPLLRVQHCCSFFYGFSFQACMKGKHP